MSSYKLHSVFAIVLGFLFFQNPLLIGACFIGANFPDNDHEIKKDNVYRLIIVGLVLFIILYILKLPYNLAILICLLGLIFLFSSHRGFTHSIFGSIIISIILYLIILMASKLLFLIPGFKSLNNYYILSLIIVLIFLSVFSLNRESYIVFPFNNLNNSLLLFALFLGLLSHIILDSFSSSGVKVLSPLYNKKFYKTFGILMIVILFILSFLKFRGILYLFINYYIFKFI